MYFPKYATLLSLFVHPLFLTSAPEAAPWCSAPLSLQEIPSQGLLRAISEVSYLFWRTEHNFLLWLLCLLPRQCLSPRANMEERESSRMHGFLLAFARYSV